MNFDSFIIYDTNEICYVLSEGIAINSSNNHTLFKLTDNMIEDRDTGKIYIISGWPDTQQDS